MGDIELVSLYFVLVLLLFPFLIYIGYCIHFYRIHWRFLYNPDYDIEVKSRDKTIEHEEIVYRTADGINISAWYVPFIEEAPHDPENTDVPDELTPRQGDAIGSKAANRNENSCVVEFKEPAPPQVPVSAGKVILFCHGNSGNISQRIDTFKIFRRLGFSTFIFDYRGYGQSEGRTTEKGTYLDADGAWNYLVKEKNVKPEDIIVFGRSLGGAIASYLAQKYQPCALVIESSFTSVSDMAKALFPALPVKLLLRFKYNTRERLKDIHCPILIIHSPDDRTIPYACGQILYEIANPPKKFLRIKGDHLYGFIRSKRIYIKGLRNFFAELPDPFITVEASVDDI